MASRDERRAEVVASGVAAQRVAPPKHLRQIDARRLERRNQPEDAARRERDDEREAEHAQVEEVAAERGDRLGSQGREDFDAWMAKELPPINAALAKKKLDPVKP